MTTLPRDGLRRFQEDGDLEALLAHATAAGGDADELRAALAGLEPVFDALLHGEHPNADALDRAALRAHASATAQVARAMAGSGRADLRDAGFQVIGVLDDPALVGVLREALGSDAAWERLSAAEALGRMSPAHARPVLEAAADHADPATRRAVADALARLGTEGG